MSETCSVCRGEGEVWDDRAGRWTVCENCGGEGYVDPYEQDEWYEDDEPEYDIYSDFNDERDKNAWWDEGDENLTDEEFGAKYLDDEDYSDVHLPPEIDDDDLLGEFVPA